MPSSTPTDWVDLVMAWIREIGPFGLVGLVLGMVPGFLAALVVWLFAPRD